ncbi:hypothetical protein FRC96_08675 [Lujinxingia vulgaris]|uniref:Peptidase C-terminal archaeal/bacterial domain-containing protein n=1 Tax=Lujinxingia vulgaris TaxID=2600176 RepID=A0A5C6X4L4_9DELT|nr:hypothetical protein [Lujinxingia vulgaris]TXD36788.1 hypothetical protein FRC96_08675 [Lujinxingia vulgaris]
MSRKLFAMLLVGLLSASVTACGGDDTPADTPDTDVDAGDDAGEDTDTDPNEPHPFEDEVDVWMGDTANSADAPQAIEAGETIGGELVGAPQYYELTLEAGTALKVTVEAVDGDLAGEDTFGVTLQTVADEGNRALFYAEGAASREFFIYADGSHLLVPSTGEELSGAYKITTEVVELDPQEPTLPGVTEGDMSDGSIKVFEVVADLDGTLAAETSAQRLAPEGGVDTFLHVWDVAAEARIAQNDDFGDGHYDSQVFADITNGNTYYVIVDAYSNDADGLFELTMETYEGGSTEPVVIADGAEETGNIEARLVGTDIKAYSLTVEPGENFRVLVEADDALTPAIVAVSGPAGEEQQAGSSLPVEGRAGMYVGVGADEEEGQTFTLYVSDERNLTEDAEPVGGEGFGYTLTVEAATRNAVSLEDSTSSAQVLADVGNVTWFDVVVPAKSIVSLAVETEVAEDDFTPLVVSAAYWTFSPAFGGEAVLYNDADEAVTMPVLVRDAAFRGAATTTYTLNATFVDGTLPEGPTTYTFTDPLLTSADAEVIELPAQVFGMLDSEAAAAIDEEATPVQFFSIDLVAGDVLVARTSRGAEAPEDEEEDDPSTTDTIVRLFEGDGTTQILEADYYVGQADAETFFSAFSYEVEEDGTYFLSVEPYCSASIFGVFCADGEYRLDVFTDGAAVVE